MNGRRDPARAAESVLEVLPCLVGAPGPQLRDAQIHERERPVVGRHGQLVCLCCARRAPLPVRALPREPWRRSTAPAGELDVEDGQVHVEDAPSLCRELPPRTAGRPPIGRRPRRAGRGGCGRSKARPRDFRRPDGRRPGTRRAARGASRPGRPSSARSSCPGAGARPGPSHRPPDSGGRLRRRRPSCSCQAAAARCSDGIVAGSTRRNSRRKRSANRWW